MFVYRIGGIMAAGVTLCSSMLIAIPYALPVAGAMVVGGFVLDKLGTDDKYENLWRMCGIENKNDQVPIMIKKQEKGNEKTLVLHLPAGISQKHFEAKQQELEQFLNAKIELTYNKNLIMKVIGNNLKSRYDYVFEACENPLEVYCGECHNDKFNLDIAKCPHVIIAGETGSGKSSLLRNIVLSMILNEQNIDLHLIDFQAVELGIFEDCKKVRSYGEKPSDFERLLDEIEEENERRLKLFRSVKRKVYIENLATWNKKYPDRALPYKIVVIDEFSRLAESEYEGMLEKFRTRVSMDRKVGIHYIVSMQRPDVKCISGSIKANMPTRIAFRTFSKVDSEVILDQPGAEAIKTQGRFLIKYCGEVKEVQALYLESDKVRKFLKENKKYKTFDELAAQKRDNMKKLRDKCINPFLNKEGEG